MVELQKRGIGGIIADLSYFRKLIILISGYKTILYN